MTSPFVFAWPEARHSLLVQLVLQAVGHPPLPGLHPQAKGLHLLPAGA